MRSMDIVHLQQESRESAVYWRELQKKFPVRSAGLKLVNNNTMREWSYKGLTLVSPPGGNNRKLVRVARSDATSKSLPPTYREAPDFRDRRARTAGRNYRDRFQEIFDMHKRPCTTTTAIDDTNVTEGEIVFPSESHTDHKIIPRNEETSCGRSFDVATMQGIHHLGSQSVHYSPADVYFRMNIIQRNRIHLCDNHILHYES